MVALGSAQRVRALNLFLHDIYHQQDILKANIIPELQILTHEAYQPHMYQHSLKGGIYSQISGIDVIRDSKGEFYVLEDNLRTPSGVSYMLECRKISEKLMPKVFEQSKIAEIEQYPQLLKEILIENAYVDKPFVVVLTPGRFNSAYYEHAFLAREMDVPLVTSRDLFVDDSKVYVKTIRGRQRVDVIYRRVDDAFLDPLCFKPDSVAHLDQLVVKEAQGSGGYGMLIGPQASKQQIETFREKILAAPHLYIAQPTLDLSVSPTLTNFGIAERHIDLRPFVLSSPYRTEIVQGGLTRVAMQPGSLVVNSSQGGGIKDTWVVDNLHS